MEESESTSQNAISNRVLRILGLNEETVLEVGGSHYVHPMIVCVLRFFMGVLNLVPMFLLMMNIKKGGFRLFWDIRQKSPWVAIEMWTSSITVLSCFLRGYVSGQATVKETNHLLARIAGPLSFAAATLAIFSAAVCGQVKLSWDRNIIYGFPIFAFVIDIVLGSRNNFRIRAIGIPLGVIQMQQTIASAYLWIYTPKLMRNLRFFGLGIAYNIVGVLCAFLVIVLTRITSLCAPRAPKHEDTGMFAMAHY